MGPKKYQMPDFIALDSNNTKEQNDVMQGYNKGVLKGKYGVDLDELMDYYVNEPDSLLYILNKENDEGITSPYYLRSRDDLPRWWKEPLIGVPVGTRGARSVPYPGTEPQFFMFLDSINKGLIKDTLNEPRAKLYKEWQDDNSRIRRIFSR